MNGLQNMYMGPLNTEEEMSMDDPRQYLLIDIGLQRALLDWIHNSMNGVWLRDLTSYGMKHRFEAATKVYVTNGVFKGAMLAAGFEPKDSREQNWTFIYSGHFAAAVSVREQMSLAFAEAGCEPDARTAGIFEDIMASVSKEAMPFRPVISVMDCGGWRADWLLKTGDAGFRLVVSAAPGLRPVIFWELNEQYGVDLASFAKFDGFLRWFGELSA